MFVKKVLNINLIFLVTTELIPDKNQTSVIFSKANFHSNLIWWFTKELIQEKNHTNVIVVTRVLLKKETTKHMLVHFSKKEFKCFVCLK